MYFCTDKSNKFTTMRLKMKSLIVTLTMGIMPLSNVSASVYEEDNPLQVGYVDPSGNQGPRPRGPILVPDVSLDSHTLYLYNVGYDLTLVLLDEDDEVAYTAFIPANTASVVLPATLSGDYEMQLYPGGSYYFYGWVEL